MISEAIGQRTRPIMNSASTFGEGCKPRQRKRIVDLRMVIPTPQKNLCNNTEHGEVTE